MKSKIFVKVKPYEECIKTSGFVEDMKRFCGKEYRVINEVYCYKGIKYFTLEGCGDWQFGIDVLEIV
jgi:hypothetical protein